MFCGEASEERELDGSQLEKKTKKAKKQKHPVLNPEIRKS